MALAFVVTESSSIATEVLFSRFASAIAAEGTLLWHLAPFTRVSLDAPTFISFWFTKFHRFNTGGTKASVRRKASSHHRIG